MAPATKVKPPVVIENPSDAIPTAESEQVYGDSEAITLGDISGESSIIELDPDSLAAATKPKEEETEEKEEGDDKTKTAETTETEEEEETEEDEEATEKAKLGTAIVDKFNESPHQAMKQLWDAAPADEQAAFLNALTGGKQSAATSADLPAGYEPESDFEKALIHAVGDLRSVPEFKTSVKNTFSSHADFINEAHVKLQTMDAMLEAIAQAIGVDLPKPDLQAILKAVKAGKSYDDATKGYRAQVQKATATAKQAKKDRPASSKSSAGNAVVFKGTESLAEMIKNYQQRV